MNSYLSLIPISARARRRQNRMTILCVVLAALVSTVGPAKRMRQMAVTETISEL